MIHLSCSDAKRRFQQKNLLNIKYFLNDSVTSRLKNIHSKHPQVTLAHTVLYTYKTESWALKSVIGTLSKDVLERRTSTGSEAFSLFICLDANKLVLLSFFSLFKTIYPRVSTKPLPNDAKSPLPVDVRRSKTLLLKLPNNMIKCLEVYSK